MMRSRVYVLIRARVRAPFYCLLVFFSIALAGVASSAQSSQSASAQTSSVAEPMTGPGYKQEILRRIALYEDGARNADSRHVDHPTMIEIYRNLGLLYGPAGMFPKAEAATMRTIELMKGGPQDQLAEEFNHLSLIHGLMGNFRQAEKDQGQALAIREKVGDPVGIALTWIDIAGLYDHERKYKKALEYAQKSYDAVANRTDMKPSNHIAVLEVTAFALCGTRQCSKGVPIMKRALEESKDAYGQESLSAAVESFALGYVYWKSGDIADANEWMQYSITRIKAAVGSDSPIYASTVKQYAQFLHQTKQREEARNADAEVHRIESVLDARTLTFRGGEFLRSGAR
jgi:tetratricopeptide (TPR) repeat protein